MRFILPIVFSLLGVTAAQARGIPVYKTPDIGCFSSVVAVLFSMCEEDKAAERLKGRQIPESMLRACDERVLMWVEGSDSGIWGHNDYAALESCLLEAALARMRAARVKKIPVYNISLGCAWRERDRLEAKTGRSVESFTEDDIRDWKNNIGHCELIEANSFERLEERKRLIAQTHMGKCDKVIRKGETGSYIALEICIYHFYDAFFPKGESPSMGNIPVYDIRKEICKSSTPPTDEDKECEEREAYALKTLKGKSIPKDVSKTCQKEQAGGTLPEFTGYTAFKKCIEEILYDDRLRARARKRELIVPEAWKQRPDR